MVGITDHGTNAEHLRDLCGASEGGFKRKVRMQINTTI